MKIKYDQEEIEKALEIINRRGIVTYPTDTDYGIWCNLHSNEIVKKYNVNSRDSTNPLPVLVYSVEITKRILLLEKFTEKIIEKFWLEPIIIILKLIDEKLKKSLFLNDKIAIRVPNHKCILEILKKYNFLVGRNTNISGHPSFTNLEECCRNIHDYDIFVDVEEIRSKTESTIIEIENKKNRIIQEGSLTRAEVLEVWI